MFLRPPGRRQGRSLQISDKSKFWRYDRVGPRSLSQVAARAGPLVAEAGILVLTCDAARFGDDDAMANFYTVPVGGFTIIPTFAKEL